MTSKRTGDFITAEEFQAVLAEPRRHKFGARRTELDNITFPSMKEANVYAELVLLEQAGDIFGLEVDARSPIRYPLIVAGYKVGEYRPDFRFREGPRVIIADAKGFLTPVFRLKAKLLAALYPDVELRIL